MKADASGSPPRRLTGAQAAMIAIFLLASLGHVAAGFLLPIPGWQMFARVDRFSYELRDVHGAPLDIRTMLPARAYAVLSARTVPAAARWFAEKHPDRAPLTGRLSTWDDEGEETYRAFEVRVGPDGRAEFRGRRW